MYTLQTFFLKMFWSEFIYILLTVAIILIYTEMWNKLSKYCICPYYCIYHLYQIYMIMFITHNQLRRGISRQIDVLGNCSTELFNKDLQNTNIQYLINVLSNKIKILTYTVLLKGQFTLLIYSSSICLKSL